MTRAQKILQFIEQDKYEPTFGRTVGAARTDIRHKVRQDNMRRIKQKRKAKNLFLAGDIDRKTMRNQIKRKRTATQQARKRLKNQSMRPGHQGPLNIYDLRGSKRR